MLITARYQKLAPDGARTTIASGLRLRKQHNVSLVDGATFVTGIGQWRRPVMMMAMTSLETLTPYTYSMANAMPRTSFRQDTAFFYSTKGFNTTKPVGPAITLCVEECGTTNNERSIDHSYQMNTWLVRSRPTDEPWSIWRSSNRL